MESFISDRGLLRKEAHRYYRPLTHFAVKARGRRSALRASALRR